VGAVRVKTPVYVPAAMRTSSPGAAASTAAWIVVKQGVGLPVQSGATYWVELCARRRAGVSNWKLVSSATGSSSPTTRAQRKAGR
jgi:hypothetical protein